MKIILALAFCISLVFASTFSPFISSFYKIKYVTEEYCTQVKGDYSKDVTYNQDINNYVERTICVFKSDK